MQRLGVLFLVTTMAIAGHYSIQTRTVDTVEVYVLQDASTGTEVWVAPAFGNNAYRMKVRGKPVFWAPERTLGDLVSRPTLLGNPLLWPWANRIDQTSYWVNGRKYTLNTESAIVRLDGNKQPIHGLLTASKLWQAVQASASDEGVVVKSRLEFWRYPELMAQFPFAHSIEMAYRLSNGALEVETTIENLSAEPLPVSLGYHPYFRINDAPRDEWRVTLPATQHVRLTPTLVPSGELEPNPYKSSTELKNVSLDDVFTGLERNAQGFAVFTVEGRQEKIAVEFGPKYHVAVVYAPPGRDFICFEPMTGVTNAFNAAHAGWYKDLQSVAPGETWREVYRIRPTGF